MKILAIDTSNQALTVSAADDAQVIAAVVTNEAKNHSIQLLPAVQAVVQKAGWQMADIQRIVVANGPGSFTGLRIGVTVAKTLADTLGIEVAGVSSLAVLAQQVDAPEQAVIVPLFNARNDNVFAGVYEKRNGLVASILADEHQGISNLLARVADLARPVIFIGDVAAFDLPKDATILDQTVPDGHGIVALGLVAPVSEVVADFNPNYLRKTQAELNWLAANPGKDRPQDYVARV